MGPSDEVERRGDAVTLTEADLSKSSTPPCLTEDDPRDRSNRWLDVPIHLVSTTDTLRSNDLPFAVSQT